MAAAPERFNAMVLAELRGWFDADGTCPFWETVGCRFFRLPFDQADLMSASTDGQFILDLAPRHPIYLEVLPKGVQDAVGRVHREGEPALAMLEQEGFRYQNLVDIFDAGPSVAVRRDDIRTIRTSLTRRVRISEAVEGPAMLISREGIADFRAVRAQIRLDGEQATMSAQTAEALRVRDGDGIRAA
jgi:arginine N-succinyltransferase